MRDRKSPAAAWLAQVTSDAGPRTFCSLDCTEHERHMQPAIFAGPIPKERLRLLLPNPFHESDD